MIGPFKPEKKDDELTLSAVLNVLDGINERTGQRYHRREGKES